MSNGRPRGPMGGHGRGMSGEKAKNFKGAILNINGSEISDGYGNGEGSSKDVTPI